MGRCQDGALIKDVRFKSVKPRLGGVFFLRGENVRAVLQQEPGRALAMLASGGLFHPRGEGVDVLLQEGLDAVVQLAAFIEEITGAAQVGFGLL